MKLIEENITGNLKNEAEVNAILAMIHTAPHYQLKNAFQALAYSMAEKLAPSCKHEESKILLAMNIAKNSLDVVKNEPAYLPTCMAHLEGEMAREEANA